MPTSSDKTIEMGRSLTGKLIWAPSGLTAEWQKKKADHSVHATAAMVCWLAPLYVAYQAGVVDKAWLQKYDKIVMQVMPLGGMRVDVEKGTHVDKARAAHMGAEAFYRSNFWTVLPTNPKPAVAPGEMVYFFRPGYDHAVHYALCTKTPNVLSLWSEPNGINNLQECTIEALRDVIMDQHGGPVTLKKSPVPWLA